MELKKGMRVEMCSSEDGYGGAWFEGVILIVSTDARRCKFQYDKFVTDDGKALVEEEVWLHSEVRPIPPHVQSPLHYSVRDAVEAYDTDCWWRGVIIKRLQGAEEELWLVYFPDTCTLKAYPHSDLRPAQDWFRGNWILAPQERSPIIEQVIWSFTVDNSEEARLLISGGEDDGRKRGRAVKAKGASLGGRGFDKRKKLKIAVNTTVSRQQNAQGESEIFKTFRFWKPFEH